MHPATATTPFSQLWAQASTAPPAPPAPPAQPTAYAQPMPATLHSAERFGRAHTRDARLGYPRLNATARHHSTRQPSTRQAPCQHDFLISNPRPDLLED